MGTHKKRNHAKKDEGDVASRHVEECSVPRRTYVQEMRQDLKEIIQLQCTIIASVMAKMNRGEFDLLQNITCSDSEFDWALDGGAAGETVSFFRLSRQSFSASPQFLCFPLSLSNSKSDEEGRKREKLESAHCRRSEYNECGAIAKQFCNVVIHSLTRTTLIRAKSSTSLNELCYMFSCTPVNLISP